MTAAPVTYLATISEKTDLSSDANFRLWPLNIPFLHCLRCCMRLFDRSHTRGSCVHIAPNCAHHGLIVPRQSFFLIRLIKTYMPISAATETAITQYIPPVLTLSPKK